MGESANTNESQPKSSEDITHISGFEEDWVKRGRRKEKSVLEKESHPTDFDEEDQLIEAYQLNVSQAETNEIKEKIKKKLQAHLSEHFNNDENLNTELGNPTGKKSKRKKKKDFVETEPETRYLVIGNEKKPCDIDQKIIWLICIQYVHAALLNYFWMDVLLTQYS